MTSWLHSFGIVSPLGHSRFPSVDELRHILDQLEGYTTEYSTSTGEAPGTWFASVDGPNGAHAFLVAPDYHGANDSPQHFYFEKGWEEVNLLILKRVAEICGPVVIVPDTDPVPIVVTADLDLDQAMQAWRD